MTVDPFWIEVQESTLRQGDDLPRCLVPVFGADLAAFWYPRDHGG